MDRDFTWRSLRDRARTLPQKITLDLQILHHMTDPYGKFVELVDRAMKSSISELTQNKNLFKNFNEDQLTAVLITHMRGMGFAVYHDANVCGHCDIYVEFDDNRSWLGEAKIHSSYGTLYGGFQQLTERYSTGLPGQDRGGFIVYIKAKNSSNVMQEWMEYLCGNFEGITGHYDPEVMLGYTTHPHVGTGRSIDTTHYAVPLFHEPTDTLPPPVRRRG